MSIKFWIASEGCYGCFSNFSQHPIIVNNKNYSTTEHYFQAKKATNEKDHEIVRLAKTAMECKKTAREIDLREDWEEIKYDIMLDALRAKVDQHPKIKEILLSTEQEEIIEDSPYDEIWGCGKDGAGQNLLGKAWMDIRKEIYEQE